MCLSGGVGLEVGQCSARLKNSKEVSASRQNELEGEEQVRSESGGLTLLEEL